MYSAFANAALFWKAESPSQPTIYLFGTIHTDDNRVTDFSPAVISALKSVDLLMMEVQPAKDGSALRMPDGNLTQLLTADELDKVYALAEFHVIHRANALTMKPWLLAFIFSASRPNTPFAQDHLLVTQAEDFGKPTQGIESAQEHYSVMDSLSQSEQLGMLRVALNRTDAQKQYDDEALIKAYLSGNLERLALLNRQQMALSFSPTLWAKIKTKLLDERNHLMAQRILTQAKTRSLFVAVGASHLAGETGLIARLKQAGYQLSPIE